MNQSSSDSFLDTILNHKRSTELPQRKRVLSPAEMRRQAEAIASPARDFAQALRRPEQRVALIAEVKRASPSKGDLVKGAFDPVALARAYEANGAAAISVLTEERFFKGSLEYLAQVRQAVQVPVLRKDFIVDPYQLYEARIAGADAALLIVAALDDILLAELHALALTLSLTPLVEVHDEAEAERALKISARLIGINNRDLHTFVTDIRTTARCAQIILNGGCRPGDGGQEPHHGPIGSLIISESGIFTARDVAAVARMGASAVLVGESIITSGEIAAQVRALASVDRRDGISDIPPVAGAQSNS